MRTFDTGATRDDDTGKIDYEGFLSPLVLEAFGRYMLKHQTQADGETRPSDNWQRGMSREVYMKSMLRHVHDVWMEHDGYSSRDGLEDALCGTLFNVMGYLYEVLMVKAASKPHVENPEDEYSLTVLLTFDSWCSTCKYLTGGPMCRGCYRHSDAPLVSPSHWAVEGTN